MPRDYMHIGPTPADEPCQQVGTPDYDPIKARQECNRFIAAIRQTLGPEPEGAHLSIKSNSHDFGTYLEVVINYDTDDEEATKYAYRCESDAPTTWPEEPRTVAA